MHALCDVGWALSAGLKHEWCREHCGESPDALEFSRSREGHRERQLDRGLGESVQPWKKEEKTSANEKGLRKELITRKRKQKMTSDSFPCRAGDGQGGRRG